MYCNANNYLNNLYSGLLSNSPETVAIDIPDNMGAGRISQTTTKRGVVLSDWEMNYKSDMNVQGTSGEEFVQLIFCLNEGVSWNIANEHQGVCIQKGESCIYRGHGKTEFLCYHGNADFHFKNVKLPVTYFSDILDDYFGETETEAYEKKLMSGISKVSITPYMEHILGEMKNFSQYRGGLGYLYLESKVLEMLAVYLCEVLEISMLVTGGVNISRTDRDSIIEAKRIIDSQLAYAPSCEQLARMINLSTTKFTKGFSSMFGKPVHTYIIDQRLEKAAALLLQNTTSIGQIAATVGYTKPSNFAAAFKKKYGVLPKDYRGENQKADFGYN